MPVPEKRITLREDGRTMILAHNEITWIEAADHYLFVHTVEGKHHMVRQSMENIENSLENPSFVRIHRSRLVNLQHVRECISIDGEQLLTLDNGTKLKISRRQYREL